MPEQTLQPLHIERHPMGYCLVRPGASQYGGPLAVLAGSLPEAAPTPDKTPLGVAVWHARFKAELAKQLVEASQ